MRAHMEPDASNTRMLSTGESDWSFSAIASDVAISAKAVRIIRCETVLSMVVILGFSSGLYGSFNCINENGGRIPTYGLMMRGRSEEHTSELQSRGHLVCRLLLEKK